jgi:hypothetical protein
MHRSQGNMSGRDRMPINLRAGERLELEVGLTPLQLLNSRHKIHPLFKEGHSHIYKGTLQIHSKMVPSKTHQENTSIHVFCT